MKAGEEIQRAQAERAQVAKKRAEAAAARKAAAEERRKKAAEARAKAKEAAAAKPTPTRAPVKTKDQLMKRLELESNVLVSRMELEDAEQRLKDYLAKHA